MSGFGARWGGMVMVVGALATCVGATPGGRPGSTGGGGGTATTSVAAGGSGGEVMPVCTPGCGAGEYCDLVAGCLPLKAEGEGCEAAFECQSGWCPRGSVCCEAACDDACSSCVEADTGLADGTCSSRSIGPAPDCAGACDGSGNCLSGAVAWGRLLESATDEVAALRHATDTAGNIFLAGSIYGDLDLGNGHVATSTDATVIGDFFVGKLDAMGEGQWARSFGQPSRQLDDIAYAPGLDAGGRVVFVGRYQFTLPGFDEVDIDSSDDVRFVVGGLDEQDGTIGWGFDWGYATLSVQNGALSLVPGSADLYVATVATSSMEFGPLAVPEGQHLAAEKLMLGRITSSGTPTAATIYDANDAIFVLHDGVFDPATGLPILAGFYGDPVDFGGDAVGMNFGAFLGRFATNIPQPSWAAVVDSGGAMALSSTPRALRVARVADGAIYSLIQLESSAFLGPAVLGVAGEASFAVLQLDATGAYQNHVNLPLAWNLEPDTQLEVDASRGHIVLAGTCGAGAEVENTSYPDPSLCVFKLAPTGELIWHHVFASDASLGAMSVVADGSVVLSGRLATPLDLGGGEVLTPTSVDPFVLRLDP